MEGIHSDHIKFNASTAIGFTNLRYRVFPKDWRYFIFLNDPSTFRFGIIQFVSYLLSYNFFGQQIIPRPFNPTKVEETVQKIISISHSRPFKYVGLFGCSLALVALKILNRLDDANIDSFISFIQDNQLPDGGFISNHSERFRDEVPFSDLLHTKFAVVALDCANSKPLDLSSLKDFIYNLQIIKGDFPIQSFEFRENLSSFSSQQKYTRDAWITLKTLGFEIPYLNDLYLKVKDQISSFLDDFNPNVITDSVINQFYLLAIRTFMFPQKGIDFRKKLLPIGLSLHQSFSDKSRFIHYTDGSKYNLFYKTLTMLGEAFPKVTSIISPLSYNETRNTLTYQLSISNPLPLPCFFKIDDIKIINDDNSLSNITFEKHDKFLLDNRRNFILNFDLKLDDIKSHNNSIPIRVSSQISFFNIFSAYGDNDLFNSNIEFNLDIH